MDLALNNLHWSIKRNQIKPIIIIFILLINLLNDNKLTNCVFIIVIIYTDQVTIVLFSKFAEKYSNTLSM